MPGWICVQNALEGAAEEGAAAAGAVAAAAGQPRGEPTGPLEREITAAMDIPEPVDELMRQHLRFLYREGAPPPHSTRLTVVICSFLPSQPGLVSPGIPGCAAIGKQC